MPPISYGNDVILTPAGTVITASADSPSVNIGNKGTLRANVIVTAASGTTPSDTITIQTSHDNGVVDPWRTVAAFSAVTAAAVGDFKSFAGCDRWIRAHHVVTGTTPSLTLSVVGEAI